jgi:hypothetical protein
MKPNLTQLPINYLDSFGFEASGSIFWVKVPVGEKMIKISLRNIVNINFSRDLLDLGNDDLDIVEVNHEFRKTIASDFKDYKFRVEEINDLPELNLITFHGNTIITAICEELEIEEI